MERFSLLVFRQRFFKICDLATEFVKSVEMIILYYFVYEISSRYNNEDIGILEGGSSRYIEKLAKFPF